MTSSEQARADALADAETLRRLVESMHGVASCPQAPALLFGIPRYCSDVFMGIKQGTPWFAARGARRAAWAAFRAVPGLRGDR
jgi:hypothetical protein